ncbi:hypothetical protein CVT24_004617 [Panaeolus cyanescens]|uniref:Uncharacterized protein n=1 Tax=Panaeolus cyanescens TaxID=181874 RepID=A0A409YBE7_9AGAR|nr:hypothetical protein CVT24_004617 [Panaeolus cyanescens]
MDTVTTSQIQVDCQHSTDVSSCSHFKNTISDTNKSILQEIGAFVSLGGSENILGNLISKHLSWLVRQTFNHGVAVGRQAKTVEDEEVIAEYRRALQDVRSERDVAKEEYQSYKKRMVKTRKEVDRVKEYLNTLRWEDDEDLEGVSDDDSSHDEESVVSAEGAKTLESGVEEDEEGEPLNRTVDVGINNKAENNLDDDDKGVNKSQLDEVTQVQDVVLSPGLQPCGPFITGIYPWGLQVDRDSDTLTAPREETVTSTVKSDNTISQLPISPTKSDKLAIEVLQSISTSTSTTLAVQRTPGPATTCPTTKKGIKKLLRRIKEPGNHEIMKEAQEFLILAMATDKAKRTEGQEYLIAHWKVPTPTVSGGSSPEVTVDASAYGVGVIIKDVGWTCWRFTSSNSIPKGSNDSIVTSWAELVAAELGVRAAIDAGFRSCPLILRSDNQGVVKALKDGTWQEKHGLDDVLKRILKLCKRNFIVIKPRWIPTDDNPADDISRGNYPGKHDKFRPPSLPKVLSSLLKYVP